MYTVAFRKWHWITLNKAWLAVLLSAATGSVLFAQQRSSGRVRDRDVDIVVVGAGTGGISAAIQAARLGTTVALLEETDWIGGQMTAAGDSTMDESGGTITLRSGIYAEFLERMQSYYFVRGKAVGTCYFGDQHHCFEPSVIQKILYQMIRDANEEGRGHIEVHLQENVKSVIESNSIVTGVVTRKGDVFHCKVVIDATELGDIIPLTSAGYRMGNFLGGHSGNSCIQDITYMAIMKEYPNGVPTALWMQHAPPGYNAEYISGMRRFLRADGNPSSNSVPVNFAIHNRLRALPDLSSPFNYTASAPEHVSRTAVNWFNDYEVTTDIFDRSKRESIYCAAKLRTLDLIYYIQNELKQRLWSVADDEGYDTTYNREESSCPEIPQEFKAIEANFPPLPYVRESRRIIGEYTLSGGDVRREAPWTNPTMFTGANPPDVFSHSIAVGDYTVYLHDCNKESDLEPDLDHAADIPREYRHGPFQVPIETLIPAKVDGFLAAEKNISESRIGNAVTRLQPESMAIGQAAGALAALAVRQGVQPRHVAPETVQRTLLNFNVTLAKQDFSDLPRNVEEWRAAQFALVHNWLPERAGGFAPDQTMNRAEAAEALAAAFGLLAVKSDVDRRWGYAPPANATFHDVPLYSKYSPAVEALAAAHAAPRCKTGDSLFCPDDPETVSEFDCSIADLKHKKEEKPSVVSSVDEVDISGGDSQKSAQAIAPLTRIKAAQLLYEAVQH
jgi:hypothetical protein